MEEKAKTARFEQTILPHLDAAYNLARWLTRNEQDAQDMVQEAYLRAFKFFSAFQASMAAPGCLRLSATPVTRGFTKIARMK